MTAAVDRMPRLLSLVPYFLARPGVLISEAAEDFGITERQLRRDLELLWMCGLPGYTPADLIDLSFEGDTVTVAFDAGMRRPLRLTGAEATALLVALRAVADTPGVTDADAVRRAVAKVEAAVGRAEPAAVVVGVGAADHGGVAETRATFTDALTRTRACAIRYYTPSRDEISDRVVDPMRMLVVDARHYLEAWCRQTSSVRLFRLDRVDGVTVLDEPSRPPGDAAPTDTAEGLYPPAEDQRTAVVLLRPGARWIGEYYRVDSSEELPGGRARVRLRYDNDAWLVRLVLGCGGEAVVEEPAEVAAEIRRRAEAALRRAGHPQSTRRG